MRERGFFQVCYPISGIRDFVYKLSHALRLTTIGKEDL